jgi:phosphoribosylanthranilate isomerase
MIPAKICGITRAEDAMVAAELGAAAIGFVFYPKSPRCIDADEAARISRELPKHVARVGVFVNPDPETMIFTAELAQLTHLQLHGDESPALCRHAPLPVIKTVRAGSDPNALVNFPAVAFLVDSRTPDQYGGTGQPADWDFCRQLREYTPAVLLAGGLSSENIARAIASALPDAVDLSSSVERSPGIKDHQKLREFFEALQKVSVDHSRLVDGFFSLSR